MSCDNLTRQGSGGRRWQPGKDAIICNVHYEDHHGLLMKIDQYISKDLVLILLPKKTRSLHHAASIPTELSSQATQGIRHISHTEPGIVQ